MIQAALITAAFLGLYLQFAAFVGETLRRASGCTCSKGKVCASCLEASEAIRPPKGSA